VARHLPHEHLEKDVMSDIMKLTEAESSHQTLKSSLADDPDMTGVINEFIAILPERVTEMHELLDSENLTELCRVVHQLKGAGGGFGFNDITLIAAEAEQSLRKGEWMESIRKNVYSLIDLIRSIDGYQQEREGHPCLTPSL
jgi:HPt (histidine-containing phosphotransfer) domain-containing protein